VPRFRFTRHLPGRQGRGRAEKYDNSPRKVTCAIRFCMPRSACRFLASVTRRSTGGPWDSPYSVLGRDAPATVCSVARRSVSGPRRSRELLSCAMEAWDFSNPFDAFHGAIINGNGNLQTGETCYKSSGRSSRVRPCLDQITKQSQTLASLRRWLKRRNPCPVRRNAEPHVGITRPSPISQGPKESTHRPSSRV
jgi:hypothetical protein